MTKIIFFFVIIFLFSSNDVSSKVCELSNIKNLKSLKEKLKICDEGDKLYITYDIKIRTEKINC